MSEDLPLAAALVELCGSAEWAIGSTWESLEWRGNPADKPNKEAVIAKAREILAARPMAALRYERDRKLKEVDWITLRSVRTGEPIPQQWKEYMQALADITKTANPVLRDGRLDGVVWPTKPE